MNESLLESISLIEESVLDAEMDTLMAMANEYSKIVLLTEYADEEVLNEYEIVQEAFIMEAKKDKEPKQKDDKPKEGIIAKLKHAWGVIMGLLSKVGEWFAKKVSKVREKFSKNKGTTANPEAQQAVESCKEDVDDFIEIVDTGHELTDEDVENIMNDFKANPGKLRKLKGDLNKLKVIHNKGFIDAARKGALKNIEKNHKEANETISKAKENIEKSQKASEENLKDIEKLAEESGKLLDELLGTDGTKNASSAKQDIIDLTSYMKELSKILGRCSGLEAVMSREQSREMGDLGKNPEWTKYITKNWNRYPNMSSGLSGWIRRMHAMYPGFKTHYSNFTAYTDEFKKDIAKLDEDIDKLSKDEIIKEIRKFLAPSYQFYTDRYPNFAVVSIIKNDADMFKSQDWRNDFISRKWTNPNLEESDLNEIKTELEKLIAEITKVTSELRTYNSFLLDAFAHFADRWPEDKTEGEQ